MTSRDVSISYFLPTNEVKNIDDLCTLLKTELSIKKVSRAEATRQSISYFADHPTEITHVMPRARYKTGASSQTKIPIQLPPDMLDKVEKWVEEHSVSRNQVIRQTLINFAESKGLKWEFSKKDIKIKPEWEGICIDSEIASLLAGVKRWVINKHANEGDYSYTETDEVWGRNVKREFLLTDIVYYYEIPEEEVDFLVKEGIDEYRHKRYLEIRK